MTTSVLIMISTDLAMIAYTLWILRAAGATGRLRLGMGLAAVAWLGVLHAVLANQALIPPDISGPAFFAIVVAGVGLTGAALALSPVRASMAGWSDAHLFMLQGFRVFFGAGFLFLAARGELPAAFGSADGLSHIAAGFLGLLAAAYLGQGSRTGGNPRAVAWVASVFGLVDILVVAGTLALVLLPEITPFHPIMYAVFLPAPFWLCIHMVSIGRLLRADAPTLGPAASLAG